MGVVESSRDVTDRFAELVRGPESECRLDLGAMLIAAHARRDLDVDEQLTRLDKLAASCGEPTLDGLTRHLFQEEELQGDIEEYSHPRNSLLDSVLDRRRGIPITLSVVVLEVGRRLGVPLEGIGMPGHFLVRDKVDAVSTGGDTLTLELDRSGSVPYASIKAFN